MSDQCTGYAISDKASLPSPEVIVLGALLFHIGSTASFLN